MAEGQPEDLVVWRAGGMEVVALGELTRSRLIAPAHPEPAETGSCPGTRPFPGRRVPPAPLRSNRNAARAVRSSAVDSVKMVTIR